MKPTEIYNLPNAEMSSKWGASQVAYEKAEGQIHGAPEIAAARAALTPVLKPQPEEIDLLMGTNQRTSFAHIEALPGWEQIRWRDGVEAPSLGSRENREASLKTLSTFDDPAAKVVSQAIQRTIEDNEQIRFVRGQMGSVLPG